MKQNDRYIDLFFKKSINYYKMYNNIISNSIYLDNFPLEIFFETSNLCNARCIICAKFSANISDEKKKDGYKGSKLMKIQYLEKIYRSEFLDYCLLSHLHGFGEPLLNRDIIKFVQLLRLRDCNIDFFTNGKLLTEDIAKIIVDYSVEKIYVSFYGGTKYTYEYIMQNCDFDLAISNLKYINKYKKMTSSQSPEIGFTLAVMQSNFKELPIIAKIAAFVGAKILRLDRLAVYDFIPRLNKEYKKYIPEIDDRILAKTQRICEDNNIDLLLEGFRSTCETKREQVKTSINPNDHLRIFFTIIIDYLKYFIIYLKLNGIEKKKKAFSQLQYNEYSPEELHLLDCTKSEKIEYNINSRKNSIDIFKKDFPYVDGYIHLDKQDNNYYMKISKFYSRQFHIYCFQPFTTIFITQDGKVKPCCFWRDDYLGFELGDINTQEIYEIWNGDKFQALRDIIIKGFVHYSCYNCLILGSMPKTLEYPITTGIKKTDNIEFLNAIRKYNIIGEASAMSTKGPKFVNIVTKIENEKIIATSVNEDPQIIFDILNKDILVYIKMYVNTKLKKNRNLEIFYSYNYQNFTEENKISLPINKGENFLWCIIPNEKKIPITGIRIDPVSEEAILNVEFIFLVSFDK